MKTFKGGIHPPEEKKLVKDNPIVDFPLISRFYVLVQQHLGAPESRLSAPETRSGRARFSRSLWGLCLCPFMRLPRAR